MGSPDILSSCGHHHNQEHIYLPTQWKLKTNPQAAAAAAWIGVTNTLQNIWYLK